jgi:hypothetical protein
MTINTPSKSKAASAAQPGAILRSSGPLLKAIRLASGIPTWGNPPDKRIDRAKIVTTVLPAMADLCSAEQVLGDALFGSPAEACEIVAAVRWLLDGFPPSANSPTAPLIETLLHVANEGWLTSRLLPAAAMRVAREARTAPPPADFIAAAAHTRREAVAAHARVCAAIRLRKRAEDLIRDARGPP